MLWVRAKPWTEMLRVLKLEQLISLSAGLKFGLIAAGEVAVSSGMF